MRTLFQFVYLFIVDVSHIYEYVTINWILYERYDFMLRIYEWILFYAAVLYKHPLLI